MTDGPTIDFTSMWILIRLTNEKTPAPLVVEVEASLTEVNTIVLVGNGRE